MRIVSTLTYYHPHWTGLSVVARALAEGMVARGHDVTAVVSQHERGLPREEVLDGVRVVRVPSPARVSRTAVMPGYPAALARAVRQADVVHLHTPMPEAALVGVLAGRHRTPLVVTHHGDVVMPPGLGNRLIRRAMEATGGAALRRADAVVVHVRDYAEASAFLRPHLDRVTAVPPPVALPEPDAARAAAWRERLGLTGRPLVGFAGRFVEEKGFDHLLRAVPRLLEQVPGAHLVFAGETDVGYERFFAQCRPLWDAVSAHVTTVGLQRDPQDMADFYAMCDVFALPSRTDCFAVVQVEALLSGTPVVAADIPGAREVVRRTGSGRLVRPQDPDALAAGLAAVLREPERYRPARAAVRAAFDPRDTLDRYEGLLAEAARRR